MKVYFPCLACNDPDADNPRPAWVRSDVCDSGIYHLNCPYGHSWTITLQALKYHVLFEVAVNAIIDGYYREAVLSFQGALERFLKFYVEVVAHAAAVPKPVYENYRDYVKNASERELGAFLAIATVHNNAAPEYPGKAKVGKTGREFTSFRNAVAHKGHIPDRPAAVAFGNIVLGFVRETLKGLKASHPQAILEVVGQRAVQRKRCSAALGRAQ